MSKIFRFIGTLSTSYKVESYMYLIKIKSKYTIFLQAQLFALFALHLQIEKRLMCIFLIFAKDIKNLDDSKSTNLINLKLPKNKSTQ